MKKRLYATLLFCMLAIGCVILSACSNDDVSGLSTDESAPDAVTAFERVDTVMGQSEASPSDGPEQSAGQSTEYLDELSILEVESKEAAAEQGGFYLKRGDRYFTLDGELKDPKLVTPGKGYWNTYAYWGSPDRLLYTRGAPTYPDRYPAADDMVISYGDIPALTLENGDEIVAFSSRTVPAMRLLRLKFVGYSMGMSGSGFESGGGTAGWLWSSDQPEEMTPIDFSVQEQLMVEDYNGNEVTDFYNLNFGERYFALWQQGTSFVEFEGIADCSYYKALNDNLQIYDIEQEIDGEVTTEGYATYDVSGLEPGIYYVERGGVLEIV